MMAGARRDLEGKTYTRFSLYRFSHPPIQAQGNDPYHCQEGESPHTQKARRELQIISTEIFSSPVEIPSYRKLKRFLGVSTKLWAGSHYSPAPQSPAHTQVPRVLCPLLTSSE